MHPKMLKDIIVETLGYKIGRVDNYAYHLEHQKHKTHGIIILMKRNNQLWEDLKVLTKSN